MCGGSAEKGKWTIGGRGLSPRVRGILLVKPIKDAPQGSIPACAGDPWSARRNALTTRVYPRVCGGSSPPLDRAIRL